MQINPLCRLAKLNDDSRAPLLGCVLEIPRDSNASPLSGAALYSIHEWLFTYHNIDLADIIVVTECRWKHNPTNYIPLAPTSYIVRIVIIVKIVFVGSTSENATTDTTFLKYWSSLTSGATSTAQWKIHAGGFRLEFRDKI